MLDKFSENVFRTFDTNNNRFIGLKEFLLALYVTSSDSPAEKLTLALRMYNMEVAILSSEK